MASKQVICDTDILIDYFDVRQKRHEQTKRIIEQVIGLENILISSITKMELLIGATNKEDLKIIDKSLKRFGVILINPEINLTAISIAYEYRLSHGLALADAMIAATSIQTDLELFTYNTKDFKFIKNLSLFKFD
ncbi:MAG: type II toxin-antitoxin system VapC family toxin [Pedobacter sp.]|uniref:type II toxin-antitoxin system VapC family toxin n=1 Tax=Pedobacter sp. TaxID=1411316 RepID=UPI0028091936|nr:type II toxin-antitoxin system VapC family toxin [Pedobacter sp.]MDQ8003269.1 type II toxin-antitoxin system VapC family toxin [Pedobacter sp.]